MITAHYNNRQVNNLLHNLADKALSFVEYHTNDAPLVNQWQQLISTIKSKANRRQWVTLINPPFIPNDQYLKAIGLGEHYVRVIRLDRQHTASVKYIQRVVENGKSSVVAVWAHSDAELPDILLNDAPIECQALVFSRKQIQPDCGQMEMLF